MTVNSEREVKGMVISMRAEFDSQMKDYFFIKSMYFALQIKTDKECQLQRRK